MELIRIIEDDRIEKQYCKGFERNTSVKEIVIHATAGGGDVIDWMSKGGYMGVDSQGNKMYRANDYKKGIGLFHYNIKKDGSITQVINPDFWVYHSSSGAHDVETIGIEMTKDSPKNADIITKEQLDSLQYLIVYLKTRFPSITTLASHDYNAKKYSNRGPKPCPGTFDWQQLVKYNLKINS